VNDVTARFDEYRECVRHLWNVHFRPDAELNNDWDLRDSFDRLAVELFRVLVLRKIGRMDAELAPDYFYPRVPLMFFRLEFPERTDIMINRGIDTGYWDDPLRMASSDDLDVRFVQFHDWSLLEYRDFAHYRGRIVGSRSHSHVIGRDILIPADRSTKVICLP
jgi:hypothetical protein